jgi:hypothetical protein
MKSIRLKLIARKGPSTRVRIHVRIAVRFHAQYAAKGRRILVLYRTPITAVCKHISEKIDSKFDCSPPLAPNRMPIRTGIRTCRRTLTLSGVEHT